MIHVPSSSMTNKEQDKFWLKFHRFQMRYEQMYWPRINAALKAQVETYIKNKDTVYIRSGGMYEVLLDLYITTGANWARHTKGELVKKDRGQMGFRESIVSFIRQYFSFNLLNDAENITQTTIRLIQEVLSDAALEGWSFDKIVDKLVAPDFTAKRARLIARTETVGAANAGSLLNATASGLELNKIWIAARDNRTRLHHVEVNQKVIPKDDKFKVGDSLMDYPGDKAGSAAEVCNCRCAIAFIPVEEKAIEPPAPVDYAPYFEKTQSNIAVLHKSVTSQKEALSNETTNRLNRFMMMICCR